MDIDVINKWIKDGMTIEEAIGHYNAKMTELEILTTEIEQYKFYIKM